MFLLKQRTDLVGIDELVFELGQKSQTARYVCVSNVHMCMEVFDCPAFAQVVNQANYVVADGKPLSVAQRLLGHKSASQIRGFDLTMRLCQESVEKGLNVGFYGGASEKVLKNVENHLKMQFPDIKVCFSYSPPFRPLTLTEDLAVVEEINSAEVDILFVGIGCPKQENWMAEHKDSLNCVMLGVGAAFDFISGEKKHAPILVQRIGMEWFFRLCSEPKRLWKRYLKHNPRFVYYFLQQWLLGRKFN